MREIFKYIYKYIGIVIIMSFVFTINNAYASDNTQSLTITTPISIEMPGVDNTQNIVNNETTISTGGINPVYRLTLTGSFNIGDQLRFEVSPITESVVSTSVSMGINQDVLVGEIFNRITNSPSYATSDFTAAYSNSGGKAAIILTGKNTNNLAISKWDTVDNVHYTTISAQPNILTTGIYEFAFGLYGTFNKNDTINLISMQNIPNISEVMVTDENALLLSLYNQIVSSPGYPTSDFTISVNYTTKELIATHKVQGPSPFRYFQNSAYTLSSNAEDLPGAQVEQLVQAVPASSNFQKTLTVNGVIEVGDNYRVNFGGCCYVDHTADISDTHLSIASSLYNKLLANINYQALNYVTSLNNNIITIINSSNVNVSGITTNKPGNFEQKLITVAGTVDEGDNYTISYKNAGGEIRILSYSATSTDTINTIATQLGNRLSSTLVGQSVNFTHSVINNTIVFNGTDANTIYLEANGENVAPVMAVVSSLGMGGNCGGGNIGYVFDKNYVGPRGRCTGIPLESIFDPNRNHSLITNTGSISENKKEINIKGGIKSNKIINSPIIFSKNKTNDDVIVMTSIKNIGNIENNGVKISIPKGVNVKTKMSSLYFNFNSVLNGKSFIVSNLNLKLNKNITYALKVSDNNRRKITFSYNKKIYTLYSTPKNGELTFSSPFIGEFTIVKLK